MESKIILIRRDGKLRIGTEKDIVKDDWQYICEDNTGEYILIDKDGAKAQPMVRSILNSLELFPEKRMIRVVQIMNGFIIFFILVLILMVAMRLPSQSDMEEMEKRISEVKKEITSPAEEIKKIITNKQPGAILPVPTKSQE